MYPFNKKRGVGLKGSMNYGEVARKYTGLLMENKDFFFVFSLPSFMYWFYPQENGSVTMNQGVTSR